MDSITMYIIGLDNNLVPHKGQGIIWTNDGLVYWCIYTSLSHSEFILTVTYW